MTEECPDYQNAAYGGSAGRGSYAAELDAPRLHYIQDLCCQSILCCRNDHVLVLLNHLWYYHPSMELSL